MAAASAAMLGGAELGRRLEQREAEQVAGFARQLADTLDRGIDLRLRGLDAAGRLPTLRRPDASPDERRAVLSALQQANPEYAVVAFMAPDGRVAADSRGAFAGADASEREFFQVGRERPYVGDVHDAILLARLMGETAFGRPHRFLDLAVPVRAPGGELLGVLGAHLSVEWAREVKQSFADMLGAVNLADALVLSSEGKVLVGAPALEGQPVPTEPGLRRWPDGHTYIVGIAASRGHGDFHGLGWRVMVRQDAAAALAPLERLRRRILLWGLLATALAGGAGWVLAVAIARPQEALAAAARRAEVGGAGEAFGDTTGWYREARETAASLAAMVAGMRRGEAALREGEGRLRVALEAGGLGTWETDLGTGRSRWDARLAAMLGLPSEPVEVDGERLIGFIHPDDRGRVAREFAAATRSGAPYASEFRGLTAAGETRWFASRGLVLPAEDGAGRAIGVVRDVTERKRREEALREALAARELLQREADHRIKNSLQLVGSLLRMHRSRMEDREAVAALGDAIGRVDAVAQAHLALQQSHDLRTVDLGQMVRQLCARFGQLNPHVSSRCGAEGGLELDAERAIPLCLVVGELLTNALRHAYPPGATGSVSVDAMAADGVLTVTVADRGAGMAAEAGPSGLGSTVVRALSRQIGAEVATRSAPGQGTTVTLRLPLHAAAPPAQGSGCAETDTSADARASGA
ncbi:sensor histidine kinase [Belnapia moabensis]|uniref:sensor histidine kinase n=1 Tax=Belnapia moabensis TaxID=365533 RepID=UPI0009FE9818|nr:histidine kinase dimerization/phosphoacceptor domain -containing protein [Belnapia moabensis]